MLADALNVYLQRADVDPDDVFDSIRVALVPPADAVLAALSALVAYGVVRSPAIAMRWRRPALILFFLYGFWLARQGGVRAVEGVLLAGVAAISFLAVGRAIGAPVEEPFTVEELGLPIHETPSGLKYQEVEPGQGPLASAGRTAIVHYTGWLTDGQKFDSSRDRGRPFEFKVGQGNVSKGWDAGVATMHQGGRRRLIIPPELGYGAAGVGPIPGGATLVFDVELVDVR